VAVTWVDFVQTASNDMVAMRLETKFLRLGQSVVLGRCIDGWNVCWLGGWDKDRLFFWVMLARWAPEPPQR